MVMIVELDDTVRVNEKEDISKTICKRVVIFCVYAVLLLGFRAPKDKQRIVYYSMSIVTDSGASLVVCVVACLCFEIDVLRMFREKALRPVPILTVHILSP